MFPKLFANMFSFIPYIGVFIQYLPEFIELTKVIIKLTLAGATEIQIKRDIKRINTAFGNPDRQQSAREIDDIFMGH